MEYYSNSRVDFQSRSHGEMESYQKKFPSSSRKKSREERVKHKQKRRQSLSDTCVDENEYYKRRKHKHKRKKQRYNRESPSEEAEPNYHHHKHHHKHRRSHSEPSSDSESDHSNNRSKDSKTRQSRAQIEQDEKAIPPSRWEEETQLNPNSRLKEESTSPEQININRELQKRRPNAEKIENKNVHVKKENENWGTERQNKEEEEENQKVNFGLSGKLVEDANTYNGVTIKYSQPPEARKPKRRWRWYIFKGDQEIPFLPLHRQSAYLIGRERKVADIPTDHPSCSKQHAVLQYRLVSYRRQDGTTGRTVKPYIIDLESANGTYVNNRKIEPKCYVELLEKDVVKFGYSSREYVLLHEGSKDEDEDYDAQEREDQMSPVSLLRS